jgi:hypothetical protein
MPKKMNWSVTGSEVDEIEAGDDFRPYDGPIPPNNTILLCDVKSIKSEKSKEKANPMLTVMLVVNETDKAKKKYNGLPLWERITVVPQNAWKIRQWLDAIGATGRDWDKTLVDDDDMVIKFGSIKVAGLQVEITTKKGTNQDGDPRAEVGNFLPLEDEDDEEDADEYDEDDDGMAGDDDTPF